MKKRFQIILFMVILWPALLFSCTIFKMTRDGNTLIGNSEDWSDPDSKVWFLAPEPGKYGRVYFGFKNGWVQGGMNEQGLFFDGLAGSVKKWQPEPDRQDYAGNLCEKILEEASTVKTAISYFKKYNFPSLVTGIFIFVDKSGETAVIQYSEGRLKIDVTDGRYCAFGYQESRANNLLKNMSNLSIAEMKQILGKCQRQDSYPTQYANVYDPQKLVVHVYPAHGATKSIKFDLKKEWAKGNHYFDLPKYAEQMNIPFLKDHKTSDMINLSNNVLDNYIGKYNTGSSMINIYRSDSVLYLKTNLIFNGIMAFWIMPLSREQFLVRDLAIEIGFKRNRAGKISGLTMKMGTEVYDANRISLK